MALYSSIDALLMGSRTYEFALNAPAWPRPDKPTWVFTRRKLRLADPSITLTSDSPETLLRQLHHRQIAHAWLMGGGQLAASFQRAGLITDYILTIVPVLLGSGIRFLGDNAPRTALELIGAKPGKSGIVQLNYRTR